MQKFYYSNSVPIQVNMPCKSGKNNCFRHPAAAILKEASGPHIMIMSLHATSGGAGWDVQETKVFSDIEKYELGSADAKGYFVINQGLKVRVSDHAPVVAELSVEILEFSVGKMRKTRRARKGMPNRKYINDDFES